MTWPAATSRSTPSRFHRRPSELRDPFGGRADLEHGVSCARWAIRGPHDRGPACARLRAFRFAGRFEFEIDPATWSAIVESAPFLPRLSRERVQQEIEKTMDQVRARRASLAAVAALGRVRFADSRAWRMRRTRRSRPRIDIGMPDATHRPELAQSRARNRLTTLFLDLSAGGRASHARGPAQRRTRIVDSGRPIRSSPGTRRGDQIRGAMATDRVTDAALRRWAATIGRTYFGDFMRVAVGTVERGGETRADGQRVSPRHKDRLSRSSSRSATWRSMATISWNSGLQAGPAIGETLRRLLEVVIEDPSKNQRDTLSAWRGRRGGGTMSPFVYALLSALANVAGAMAVAGRARRSMRLLDALIAVAAGFMISVALTQLVPEALARGGTSAPVVMLAGVSRGALHAAHAHVAFPFRRRDAPGHDGDQRVGARRDC